MKIINKIILIIVLAWIIWVGYQYFTKSKIANMLLEQKVEELGNAGFDVLLQKMGKDYEYKEIQINGKNYWMGWVIVQSSSLLKLIAFHIGKPHLGAHQKIVSTEDVTVLEACIYVDYISLLPFDYFKVGYSWVLTVER